MRKRQSFMLLLTILTTTVCCYAQPSRPFLGNERVAKKPHTRRPGGTTMNKNTSGDAIVANERRVWEALKKKDMAGFVNGANLLGFPVDS